MSHGRHADRTDGQLRHRRGRPLLLAVKPVAKTLDERQQKIADGLQYAEEMKTQLAEAERERAEKIKEAAQEAQRILSEAREQSKEMIEQKTQEAAAQAEAIIRKASEATELERQKMLSDVRQEVARLVVATTSTVLSKELSDADKQSFSDAAAKGARWFRQLGVHQPSMIRILPNLHDPRQESPQLCQEAC